MNHNGKRIPRRQSFKEETKRAFHADVRKLKQKCKDDMIDMFSNETVLNLSTYICVSSTNEFELGEPATSCDLTKECYFVSISDYERYFEE